MLRLQKIIKQVGYIIIGVSAVLLLLTGSYKSIINCLLSALLFTGMMWYWKKDIIAKNQIKEERKKKEELALAKEEDNFQ